AWTKNFGIRYTSDCVAFTANANHLRRFLGRVSTMEPAGIKAFILLLRQTWSEYRRHNAQWLAAALAYFAAFAVAPLIIVLVEIAGFFLHEHRHVLDVLFRYLQRDVGPGSEAVRQIVSATFQHPRQNVLAQITGWTIFAIAAMGLFRALQFALNTVWDGGANLLGFAQALRARALGFATMLGAGLLLLSLVLANAALAVASGYFERLFGARAAFVHIADFAISLAALWLLFGMLFLILPDVRIAWRDVRIGAAITALLFTIGQLVLGWYLGRAGVSSAFGAAGSLVAFLLWANYSAQIFLFGAEFTRVYARRHGTLRDQGASAAGTAI
ncbi:MAG TPA: YihY/virulence factor BrkB family protein, partial [Candidatus Nitrosotalea sp.]|nr:YihY/virulence factor BrkB family protein [Candidatus Nitrosotalea sp.]